MDVKYNTDTKIEDNSRAFKLQKANFDKEVNTAVSDQSLIKLYLLDVFPVFYIIIIIASILATFLRMFWLSVMFPLNF